MYCNAHMIYMYTYFVLTSINLIRSCCIHVQQHAPPQIAGMGHPCYNRNLFRFVLDIVDKLINCWDHQSKYLQTAGRCMSEPDTPNMNKIAKNAHFFTLGPIYEKLVVIFYLPPRRRPVTGRYCNTPPPRPSVCQSVRPSHLVFAL